MAPYSYYGVYGIRLRSEIPLALPEQSGPGLFDIEVCDGSPELFAGALGAAPLQARSDWYHFANLPDGASYVRWTGMGEFLVASDGRRITCHRADGATPESFHVYLLGQALSFALVKSGFEPLHATAIAVDGEAVALLGRSGYGKSSLAACFLSAGDSLLTDDLLILQPRAGRFNAYPGPPRIKLFPNIAKRFLGSARGVPMNTDTDKLVIPLDGRQSCRGPMPLCAIYMLAPRDAGSDARIEIGLLSPRESFLALVGGTFNQMLVDPDRLKRQARATAQLVKDIEVRRISYPRVLDDLPLVRQAILKDLERSRKIAREEATA